jgi:hypothetical protein
LTVLYVLIGGSILLAVVILFVVGAMVGISRMGQSGRHLSDEVKDDLSHALAVVRMEAMVPCSYCQKLNPAGAVVRPVVRMQR